MENNNKYLYAETSGAGNHIEKYLIEKESNSFYWLKGHNGSFKVSKKTMRTGNTWHFKYYYTETPELKVKYGLQIKMQKFYRKLELLKSCKDIYIIDNILNIDYKEKQ